MLKARRKHQKTRKLLDGAAKKAKRLVKKEKVPTEKVKKVKLTKEELGRQDAKKKSADAGKKGAS
jgi:hypothetical protein